MLQRRTVILGAVGTAAGLAAAGCSHAGKTGASGASEWHAAGDPVSGSPSASAAAVTLTVSPAAGKSDVSPLDPVEVSVAGGTLQSVTVAAGSKKVAGELQSDGSWKSTDTMTYGKTYTVTASIKDSAGATVQKKSTFTTLKPKSIANITFQANGLSVLNSGGTYGVGQPVIVAFSKSISDKAAAEKAIEVETTPSVAGKFHWISNSTVHWRPEKYWAKGTKIKVSVNGLGTHFGNGVYGSANRSASFTIGRSLIAIADNNTHRCKVYVDGAMVRDMACSTGRGGYTTIANGKQIHFWTQNGPHVVLSKEMVHSMSSASYGLTDKNNPFYYDPEDVKFCTRITYSGEFLHAAPWNHQLGRANISHGCINLGEADAEWVYHTFMIGDVVQVNHSPKPLPLTDGLGDWTISYDKYGN
ncbi:L,D-transpeptidase [Actinoplanes subtropicus]|uniref:L,D-transpeptidase n=1 Tax=Actinoplanes subtropicus TaxID=543632 RepID=UPI0004C457A0|nr:Ig-like domain-containing protein [Actinoplanes subtropicus]